MNKLREKFEKLVPVFESCSDADIDKLEQITDDFSVKFYLWMMEQSKIYETKTTTTELQKYFKDNIYE